MYLTTLEHFCYSFKIVTDRDLSAAPFFRRSTDSSAAMDENTSQKNYVVYVSSSRSLSVRRKKGLGPRMRG